MIEIAGAIVYVFLGILSGAFFSAFGDLGRYANFKSTLIAVLWPLAWLASLTLAFWEWITKE